MNNNQLKFIDLHYHANPDLYLRKHDAISAGKIFNNLHGAVVLKSHLGSTVESAYLAQQLGYPVFGSLVLNRIAGGINYRTVLSALAKYSRFDPIALMVHFPTCTGHTQTSSLIRELIHPCLKNVGSEAESVSENGKLKKTVMDVLRLAKDYPICFATGHASAKEVKLLIEAILHLNIDRLLITHPTHPITGFTLCDLYDMAKEAAVWFEQSALTYLLGYQTYQQFKTIVSTLPRLIYSSDLGQDSQMTITEWLAVSHRWFNECELSEEKINEIMKINPLTFLTRQSLTSASSGELT